MLGAAARIAVVAAPANPPAKPPELATACCTVAATGAEAGAFMFGADCPAAAAVWPPLEPAEEATLCALMAEPPEAAYCGLAAALLATLGTVPWGVAERVGAVTAASVAAPGMEAAG